MRKSGILLMLLTVTAIPNAWTQDQRLNILVLHSSSADLPWVREFNDGLETVRKQNFPSVHFYYEFMATDFSGNRLNTGNWIFYLQSKYSQTHFDFIIADLADAVILLDENPQLFRTVPRIFSSDHLEDHRQGNILYLSANIEKAVELTVETALEQNPEAGEIVIIDGHNLQSDKAVNRIRQVLKNRENITVRSVSLTTMEEFTTEVRNISRNSIVFYTVIMKDKDGNSYVPRDLLKTICMESAAPVYTFWSSLSGTGIVGGHMVDSATVAKSMYGQGVQYLRTGSFGVEMHVLHSYWDWQVLKKFDFKLPAEEAASSGRTVFNRPPSFVSQNYKLIITLVIAVLIVFLAVTLLLMSKSDRLNMDLKQKQQALQEVINEKTTLLAEVDHRVKNNLQILENLVNLQIMESSNEEVGSALRDVAGRIGTLALVHRELCIAEKESQIDGRVYFSDLIDHITSTVASGAGSIAIRKEVQPLRLSTGRAIACGLIINELLLNALKYAFPGGAEGVIRVDVKAKDNRISEITVGDTGIGLPEGFDISKSSSLGLKVVRNLTSQIEADLKIGKGPGTEIRIVFKEA